MEMCGWFVGTFTKYYIFLGSPIVVDSSYVLYLLTLLVFTPISAGAERQSLMFECVVHILDFASNVQKSPAELLTTCFSPRKCNTTTLRNSGVDYKADVCCC